MKCPDSFGRRSDEGRRKQNKKSKKRTVEGIAARKERKAAWQKAWRERSNEEEIARLRAYKKAWREPS